MRKLILQMQVSVDGFVARGGEGPEWKLWDWGDKCRWDDGLKKDFNRAFAAADTLLLSRKLVAGGYLEHWTGIASRHPRAAQFAFARRILAMRKVVFSGSLTENPWPGTELAVGNLIDSVDELKAQPGRNLLAFGGAGFAGALIAANLVDEFEFYINPVAIHRGLSIFEQRRIDQDLMLVSAKAYDCGMLVSRYRPQGR